MNSVTNIFLWKECFTTILSQSIGCQCYLKRTIKNNGNRNFSNFIDLQEKNKFGRSSLNLGKLLALQLTIIYRWQLSDISHQQTIKIHPYISRILQIFCTQMFFSISFDKCLFTQSVTQRLSFLIKNIDGLFPDQKERPSSKLLKQDLVYLLNTFGDSSLRIFAAGKSSLLKINVQIISDLSVVKNILSGFWKVLVHFLSFKV